MPRAFNPALPTAAAAGAGLPAGGARTPTLTPLTLPCPLLLLLLLAQDHPLAGPGGLTAEYRPLALVGKYLKLGRK